MTVNVVDAIMGAGKTSAAINYINKNKDDYKFIYITPYLEEVKRIEKACSFSQPVKYTDNTPKIVDLKNLLNKGKNIITTHSMFHLFDDEVIDLCYSQGYVLFMDEVTDVVDPYPLRKSDLETLLDKYVTVDGYGKVKWTGPTDTDKFATEKRLCDLGCLMMYSDIAMLWMFPVKIFKAFRETYILTYLFDAQPQKYYYDYHGIKYRSIYITGDSVDTYSFTDEYQTYISKYDYRLLINILEDERLNEIGDPVTAFSKTWYERNKNNVIMDKVKKNLNNYFRNKQVLYRDGCYVPSSSKNNLWTTFSDYRTLLSGKGYSKGYISSNLRATNQYRDRTVVAYMVNKYFNPVIKNFFVSKGIEVDEDLYAVSEMVQLIWRSGIRDGERITVYVPSSRMRALLRRWIDTCNN